MIYICLLKRPRQDSLKVDSEFISVHNTLFDTALDAYSYMIDGHETEVLQFRPEDDHAVVFRWMNDPSFFEAVKSEFKKRDEQRRRTLALKSKPLRAEDV